MAAVTLVKCGGVVAMSVSQKEKEECEGRVVEGQGENGKTERTKPPLLERRAETKKNKNNREKVGSSRRMAQTRTPKMMMSAKTAVQTLKLDTTSQIDQSTLLQNLSHPTTLALHNQSNILHNTRHHSSLYTYRPKPACPVLGSDHSHCDREALSIMNYTITEAKKPY